MRVEGPHADVAVAELRAGAVAEHGSSSQAPPGGDIDGRSVPAVPSQQSSRFQDKLALLDVEACLVIRTEQLAIHL